MPLRNNVSFDVLMPFDLKLHPIGEEIAAYLANSIEQKTGMNSKTEIWRDSGYELDFLIGPKPFRFAFCYVGDQKYQFYGQVASEIGWLRRLFGYRDQVEEEALIRAVHRTLTSDPTFTNVRWHEAWYDEKNMSKEP